MLQLAVFDGCPFTLACTHSADAGIQDIVPSDATLISRSTRNQHGNGTPILATMRLYRLLQLAIFVFCPFTRTFIHPVDAGIQDIVPSLITLYLRSTRNEHGNCGPILATVCLNRIYSLLSSSAVHLSVRIHYHRRVVAGIQDIVPSVPALIFRSTWNQRGNFLPILVTVVYLWTWKMINAIRSLYVSAAVLV
jgi:hypothetical protein